MELQEQEQEQEEEEEEEEETNHRTLLTSWYKNKDAMSEAESKSYYGRSRNSYLDHSFPA
ncbi:hypothetical protein E2C01_027442 [Portunus trituberculatus]|uniref:Uncharacterized protein n=1 Tax=Portunus trituberculatus TaxID=210409 RepID=A0A5B7EL59_PORTR|nr:hypothetical protein [Portunus trituberculatus]